jgi:hypothetical protein
VQYPDLTDAELTEIINRRVVVDEVSATGEYQVVAVDVADSWAAVFRFSLSGNGDVDTETDVAARQTDGSWLSDVGGGVRSAGWEVPWRRPANGWWDGDPLITFGLCGKDVEVDGEDMEMIAVSGFASGATDRVRVTTPAVDRLVVPAPTGAFVVIGFGRGVEYMSLTALQDGEPLGRTCSFPSAH